MTDFQFYFIMATLFIIMGHTYPKGLYDNIARLPLYLVGLGFYAIAIWENLS